MRTRLRTRQPTTNDRLDLKRKIHRAITKAIAMRMAESPRFESTAANEIWSPTPSEIARDVLGQAYGQDVYQRYGQQQQLEGTVRQLMNDNASGYAEGLGTATDTMLDDGYGQDDEADGYGGFSGGFVSGLVG